MRDILISAGCTEYCWATSNNSLYAQKMAEYKPIIDAYRSGANEEKIREAGQKLVKEIEEEFGEKPNIAALYNLSTYIVQPPYFISGSSGGEIVTSDTTAGWK
jgi:hypothetical protein